MLHFAIAVGLLLGLAVGLGASITGNEWLHAIASGSVPFGTVFMNAIKMVVIPLIVTVIFTSVARLGDPRRLGRIGGLTLAFYWTSLLPAIAIGMGVMHIGLKYAPQIEMPATSGGDIPPLQGFSDFLISLIPANPFAAAANGTILPLIVFTALVAAATGTLSQARRERLINLADDVSQALVKLVWWILYTAPLGVFGLAAPVTAHLGWDLVQSLGVFILSVLAGLVILLLLVFLPLMYFFAKIGPGRFLGGTFGAVSVAASATSTAAAIPVTLEETTRNLEVSHTVADVPSWQRAIPGCGDRVSRPLVQRTHSCCRGRRRNSGNVPRIADGGAGTVLRRRDEGARTRSGWRAGRRTRVHARHRPDSGHDAHGHKPAGSDFDRGAGRSMDRRPTRRLNQCNRLAMRRRYWFTRASSPSSSNTFTSPRRPASSPGMTDFPGPS